MAEFTFEIEVYSDTICPWCYIGKKTLEKAIATYTAQHPAVDFKLTWKPFMLWPTAKTSAYQKGAILHAIYGPRAPVMFERLARLGALHGIDFRWEGKSGNSRDSHKLILLAMEQDDDDTRSSSSPSPPGLEPTSTTATATTTATTTTTNNSTATTNPLLTYKQTKQERTIAHLFASAFEQGQDLSSRAFLARAAVTLGLVGSEEEALAYLEQQADEEDPEAGRRQPGSGTGPARRGLAKRVDESSARARQIGMTAVPSYVVQGRWQVGGMQGEDVWLRIFEKVRATKSGKKNEEGSSLDGLTTREEQPTVTNGGMQKESTEIR
ncbi:thioredoxin-like protein [Chaetomium strumarium]|uniref:Thioredoxin-like protein n=1 Tax=Chaetomium strumarium TaxID=1170767 RepID=A0AAJ0GP04_9PEZI|nr:thioredoxin-like protein [Chaetomium strumarium]